MMTDRRLEKLYPALSATERVVLILGDRKRGDEDDPKVRATMPRDQSQTFERLLRNVGIANSQLGGLIITLHEAARAQEWRWRWFAAEVARHNDFAELCKEVGAPKLLRPLIPPIDLDSISSEETLPGLAPQLLKGSRETVVALAGQAHDTAQILEEFSGELDGADPLGPRTRAFLVETELRLDWLLGELEVWVGPVERADGAYLDDLRGLVESARRPR